VFSAVIDEKENDVGFLSALGVPGESERSAFVVVFVVASEIGPGFSPDLSQKQVQQP
jgi:hypothetical protein